MPLERTNLKPSSQSRFLLPLDFLGVHGTEGPEWPLAEARKYTRWLARNHYENFQVVSLLLPRRLRQDFYNVYAFCRWADDLGDETGDPQRSLQLLDWWGRELQEMYLGRARHPVFVALRETVARRGIPQRPFEDLLSAFVQDQKRTRYENYEELLRYCERSANPVGRLVLYVCGYSDAERQSLSDCTCTALQLANFWQDVRRDWEIRRVYLPLDLMARHGYSLDSLEQDIQQGSASPAFRSLLQELVERAESLFQQGQPLVNRVRRRLAVDIDLFTRGGMFILESIRRQDYDVIRQRPELTRRDKTLLLAQSLRSRLAPQKALRPFGGGRAARTFAEAPSVRRGPAPLEESYAHCESVARKRARNFYYSFLLLPREQKEAMCALYAFMRYCDDVSDDTGSPVERRRTLLAEWRRALEQALREEYGKSLILPAFHQTIVKYGIPPEYFFELIQGVESDLTTTRYATFDDLYRYCYRVASIVGMTSIRVFGYEDSRALALAEKCGVAFQLTNILRDIPEDARRGRIYIPTEELQRFGLTPEDCLRERFGAAFRDMMEFQWNRARSYYQQAAPLLRLVKPESQGALWAMMAIYFRILSRIRRLNYDVFAQRPALSLFEKVGILTQAFQMRFSGGAIVPLEGLAFDDQPL